MTEQNITLTGELDISNRPEITALFKSAEHADVVNIDMAAVTYIDSTALNSLITLQKSMIEHGHTGTINILNPTPHVAHIFEICGLEKFFTIAKPTSL